MENKNEWFYWRTVSAAYQNSEGEKVSMGSSTSELLAQPVRILERVEG